MIITIISICLFFIVLTIAAVAFKKGSEIMQKELDEFDPIKYLNDSIKR